MLRKNDFKDYSLESFSPVLSVTVDEEEDEMAVLPGLEYTLVCVDVGPGLGADAGADEAVNLEGADAGTDGVNLEGADAGADGGVNLEGADGGAARDGVVDAADVEVPWPRPLLSSTESCLSFNSGDGQEKR